jgi:hypothetical protein
VPLWGIWLLVSEVGVPWTLRHAAKPPGRHPLAELLAPGRFIDNDTHLGASPAAAAAAPAGDDGGPGGEAAAGTSASPRMLLLTGPNASGKSVYMKQVCLLCVSVCVVGWGLHMRMHQQPEGV